MASIVRREGVNGPTYRVVIRLKGAKPVTKSFPNRTLAKEWARRAEIDIKSGRYFKTVEASKHTLGAMIDRYLREVLPKKSKAMQTQKAQLEFWKREIGFKTLEQITPQLIIEVRERLLGEETHMGSERSAGTLNRFTAALSHAYSIAVSEWGWIDDNPLRKVRKKPEPRGRVRFLSDKEREKLLEAAKAHSNRNIYPIVVLAISTGMRKNEILGLKWADVDLTRARIILHDTKNKERRSAALAGHALEVITAHSKVRRLNTEFVFPSPTENKPLNIIRCWSDVVENAGLEDFRFHDLRHTAASYLAMNGATTAEIAEVLGHKTLAMVKRYSHLTETHTAKVVEKMNKAIFS